jgi:transmembrane sensor
MDVQKLPSLSQVKKEASEWIARLDVDDVSGDDRARFEHWRSANATNARTFEELSATYQEFVAAGTFVRAVSFAQSMNEAACQPKRWLIPVVAASAVVILAVSVAVYCYRSAAPLTYRTALGEHATIALPDGSTLELNSGSTARVLFETNRRVIRLDQGEGYFVVAHDARRPFWVVAARSWVRAVGTAFNVYLRATAVQVTVSEGAVKVGSSDSTFASLPADEKVTSLPESLVRAGEQAELRGPATATRPLSSTELARAVGWRHGILYFENQPLSEVSRELERYSDIRFILEDDSVRQLRVAGTFQASPRGAESLIAMLAQGFGLNVRREADRVYIESQSAPQRR